MKYEDMEAICKSARETIDDYVLALENKDVKSVIELYQNNVTYDVYFGISKRVQKLLDIGVFGSDKLDERRQFYLKIAIAGRLENGNKLDALILFLENGFSLFLDRDFGHAVINATLEADDAELMDVIIDSKPPKGFMMDNFGDHLDTCSVFSSDKCLRILMGRGVVTVDDLIKYPNGIMTIAYALNMRDIIKVCHDYGFKKQMMWWRPEYESTRHLYQEKKRIFREHYVPPPKGYHSDGEGIPKRRKTKA